MKYGTPFSVSLILASVLLGPNAFGAGDMDSPPSDPGSKRTESTHRYLTRYLIEAELGLLGVNLPGHTLRTRRHAHLRLVEYGGWFLDGLYEEELLFGFACDQVNHIFDYLRLGRNLGPLDAFFFWHHTCNNPVWGRGVNEIHWNVLGLELTTDASPGAWRKHGYHFRVRAGRMFMISRCKYRWTAMAFACLRPFQKRNEGPFASIKLDVVGDPARVTLCPVVEVGVTVPLGRGLAIEPFARLERRRDALGYLEDTDNWLLVGMRMVQIGDVEPGMGAGWEKRGGGHLGIRGGYAIRLLQREIGYISNVAIRYLVPGFPGGGAVLFKVHGGIDTAPNDMNPMFTTLTLEPAVEGPVGPLTWAAHYRFRERRAGRDKWSGPAFKCLHAIGFQVGQWDRMPGVEEIQPFPERFRWSATFTAFPAAREFPFKVEVGGRVRVRLFDLERLPFFFSAETRHFFGPDNLSVTGLASELSVTLPGTAGDFRLYLRFEHAADPFRHGRGDHYFLGFEMAY